MTEHEGKGYIILPTSCLSFVYGRCHITGLCYKIKPIKSLNQYSRNSTKIFFKSKNTIKITLNNIQIRITSKEIDMDHNNLHSKVLSFTSLKLM